MPSFLDLLSTGKIVLMDGAMGTELRRAGLRGDECGELWNLAHPERVLAIHRAYVEAGAQVTLTNTFQANAEALNRWGLAEKISEIFRAGVRLARIANPDGFVLADVGPARHRSDREMKTIVEEARQADALLLETFSDPGEAAELAALALDRGIPLLLAFTFHRPRLAEPVCTFKGFSANECARCAAAMKASALGVNCGRDLNLADYVEILRVYRNESPLPLFVRPNAGTPRQVGDSLVYPRYAHEMAEWLPRFVDAGVCMVGGCCGTTPASIAAIKKFVSGYGTS